MSTDPDTTFVEDLRSIRSQYDLPQEMDNHLYHIIMQAENNDSPIANANETATRIQQLLTYLMEDYRDDFDKSERVRDDLADIYATISTTYSTT